MKRVNWPSFCARLVPLVILALGLPALAGNRTGGTTEEARSMLLKAIDHYKSVGRQQALADFTAKKPPFADRDLYVLCFSPDRTVIANGAFPSAVGTNGDVVIDVNGRGVATAARNSTSAGGNGVVQYRWVNPLTRTVETKVAFFARVGDDVCGVGTYTP